MRVGDLVAALDWEKSRVSHLLTRMEARELVARADGGSRRTGVGLTAQGRDLVRKAVEGHGSSVRRYFLDSLTPEQASVIGDWSAQTVERLGRSPG